jgi:uncharacterized SAM-dependent methyltransferase
MSELAHVLIHSSQFPEAVRRDLLESLRLRKVNHKFHYDSYKQTQKWLALHQAYSPARTNPGCAAIYRESFSAAAQRLPAGRVHVVGLGCGGGQKETALLTALGETGRELFYTPSDVSSAMVLVALQSAREVVPEANCFPLVCDLATAGDLSSVLRDAPAQASSGALGTPSPGHAPNRLFTFFGMIPNFEPEVILPLLAKLVGPEDHLLFSANLAPGKDYAAGVQHVLPLYDNELTRDWLLTFLLDLGVERADGELRFVIEDERGPVQLKRIAGYFHFIRDRTLEVNSERFEFLAGESIRLFFSYRHTPALVDALLRPYGLEVIDQWVAPSQEEGVFFLNRRA